MKIELNIETCPKRVNLVQPLIGLRKTSVKFNAASCVLLIIKPGDKYSFEVEGKHIYLKLDPKKGFDLSRKEDETDATIFNMNLAARLKEFAGTAATALEIDEFKEGRWLLKPVVNTTGKAKSK